MEFSVIFWFGNMEVFNKRLTSRLFTAIIIVVCFVVLLILCWVGLNDLNDLIYVLFGNGTIYKLSNYSTILTNNHAVCFTISLL